MSTWLVPSWLRRAIATVLPWSAESQRDETAGRASTGSQDNPPSPGGFQPRVHIGLDTAHDGGNVEQQRDSCTPGESATTEPPSSARDLLCRQSSSEDTCSLKPGELTSSRLRRLNVSTTRDIDSATRDASLTTGGINAPSPRRFGPSRCAEKSRSGKVRQRSLRRRGGYGHWSLQRCLNVQRRAARGKRSRSSKATCRSRPSHVGHGLWSRQKTRQAALNELRRSVHRRSNPVRLRIGLFNIQSAATIDKQSALFKDFVEKRLDLAVVCETFLKPGMPVKVPKGHRLIRMDRGSKGATTATKGGGVAVLAKKRLGITSLDSTHNPIPGSKLESLWVRVRVGKQRLVIAAVYRPPNNHIGVLDADFSDLETQLQDIHIRYPRSPFVICGDLNCDLRKEGYYAPKEKLNEMLSAYSLSPYPNEPTTRFGTLLDVVLASNNAIVRTSTTQDVSDRYGTPHKFVTVVLELSHSRCKTSNVRPPLLDDRINIPDLHRRLKHADWTDVTKAKTASEQWKHFLSIFLRVESESSLAEAQRRADSSLEHQPAGSRTHPAAEFTTCGIGRRHNSEWDVPSQHGDGSQAASGSSAGSKASNDGKTFKLSSVSLQRLRAELFQIQDSSFFTHPVVDGLSVRVLQAVFDAVGEILLHIVNSSLLLAEVPPSWKSFNLVSLGARSERSTHWPVSLVPVMARVVENVVHHQLYEHVSDNHLLSDAQHGSRRNHSKETALVAISDHILSATDRMDISLLCCLNLNTDTVQLPKLLDNLKQNGVDPSWFSSYLGGDTERVSDPSSSKNVTEKVPRKMGVSLRSDFWLLLCCIFFDGLSKKVCGAQTMVFQYVDSAFIFVSGKKKDWDNLVKTMEQELQVLATWLSSNSIDANAGSIQTILFGSQNNLSSMNTKFSLRFQDDVLQSCQEVNILDVDFDRYLRWDRHVVTLFADCKRKLIEQGKDLATRVNEVRMHVMCCISVFGNGTKKNLERIEQIRKLSEKIIRSQCSGDDATVMLKDWPSVEGAVKESTLRLALQVLATKEPRELARQFVRNYEHGGISTRQDNHFHPPKPRTEAGKRRFVYRAATALNKMM